MRSNPFTTAIILPLLAGSLSACAWFAPRHPAVSVRSIAQPLASSDAKPDDGLYSDAIRAIDHREYATALDDLQAANTRAPDDVRILNAFGVVYDKLGRFDLSTRYYTNAQALDPKSPIIANNLNYSRYLQARQSVVTALAAASPSASGPTVKTDPYESLYKNAVAAISNGDNARAIALLNEARNQKTDDARVLNALGVVYDRLGRFDLSERYYAQASALDPGSPILANNRASSKVLEASAESGAGPSTPGAVTVKVADAGPASRTGR